MCSEKVGDSIRIGILRGDGVVPGVALGIALILSGIMESFGLAMIIGAYVCGLGFAKEKDLAGHERTKLEIEEKRLKSRLGMENLERLKLIKAAEKDRDQIRDLERLHKELEMQMTREEAVRRMGKEPSAAKEIGMHALQREADEIVAELSRTSPGERGKRTAPMMPPTIPGIIQVKPIFARGII